MPRFRRLSSDELQELEKEFIHFLVSNGIAAEDWVKLKKEDIDNAEGIIDTFSDIVLEKVMSKISFLEKREKTDILFFKAKEKGFEIIGLSTTNEAIDLRDEKVIADLAQNATDFSIFHTEQSYTKLKEDEIFNLVESGSFITDGTLFTHLKTLV